MRLIDADKLIKTIEEHDYSLADECGSIDRGMFTIGIMQAIDEQPVAQQWHKLIFRPLTDEEKEFHPYWTKIVENLPNLNEEVLVTDGTNIWVDGFDMDDFLYLSVSGYEVDGVIAWMEIPPYRGISNDTTR